MKLEKTVNDPVHGTIGLTKLEARLISTKAFQRLRNVKHLSLAYLVYPSANFSRFSHCIGVCHVTGRLLESIHRNSGIELTDKDIQLYRLAGLFHDIGHYPFSHPMEVAVKNYYSSQNVLLQKNSGDVPATPEPEKFEYYDHEKVGKLVLANDPEISATLAEAGIQPEEIYQIFTREKPDRFANLISSDFDADRIDYLLRTAHHTGLPYGKVDINYLISQLNVGTFDGTTWLYLNHKALKAVDHFLLSRYFDNQQAAFHKTVVGFEWILKDVLEGLLEHKLIECHVPSLKDRIEKGDWLRFDDDHVTHQMHELANSPDADDVTKLKALALTSRFPPKLLIEFEELAKAESNPFDDKKRLMNNLIGTLSEKYGVDKSLWHYWFKKVSPTKVGAHFGFGEVDDLDDDRKGQIVRVYDDHTDKPVPIVSMPGSLMSVLADYHYNILRLYVLLPEKDLHKIEDIKSDVRTALL